MFVSSLSGASARVAVVEEGNASAGLYMTAPNGEEPVSICFLYNTGRAQAAADDDPPPLDPEFASSYSVRLPVTEDDVTIHWSVEGDAVAVRLHGEFVGFIGPDDRLGYSRSVERDCDWAHRFDVELFKRLFDVE